jgi:hypothetical protein
MATTSPDNIWTPDSGDDYDLTTDLAATADTIQSALNNRIRLRRGTGAPSSGLGSVGDAYLDENSGATWFKGGVNSGWFIAAQYASWTTLTASNDWTANTGGNAPQVMRDGLTVSWRGGFFGGTSGNFVTVLPTWARPSRDSVRLPVILSDNTTIGRVRVAANGQVFLSGAISVDASFNWSVL